MINRMVNSFRQIKKYDDVEEVIGNVFLITVFAFAVIASVGDIIS